MEMFACSQKLEGDLGLTNILLFNLSASFSEVICERLTSLKSNIGPLLFTGRHQTVQRLVESIPS